MTISSTTRKTTANCNGSTHEFPFSFPIISEDDLVVQIKDANGVITTLTLDSDYEVTAVNDDFENGGSVNTITYSSGSKADYAWASGNEIIIYRDTPLTQGTAFRRGREMNPSTESGLDKITMQVQELSEEVARCIKAPIEDTATDYEIPVAADRASRYLAFDASGGAIASSGGPAGTPCSSFGATIIDDESAAEVLTTLLFSAFCRTLVGSTNLAALLTAMGLDTSLATLSLPDSVTISTLMKTLLDDTTTAAARATLEVSEVLPGTVIAWPAETAPTGYLECNGASLARVGTYAALFNVIGTVYGAADVDHFNLPDYRGRFLRGWDHGATIDPDAATRTKVAATGATMTAGDHVGTEQDHQIESHKHFGGAESFGLGGSGSSTFASGSGYTTVAATTTGGNETRPANTNVMYCIKY